MKRLSFILAALLALPLRADIQTIPPSGAISGGANSIPRPNTKRSFYCSAGGSGGTWVCAGGAGFANGTLTNIDADASDGFLTNIASGAVTDDPAGGTSNNAVYRTGRNLYFESYAKLQDTTSQRTFIGIFTDFRAPTADDPASNLAGFRCSSSASDTNWKCITNDGTAGGTINDSGIACNTTSHKFSITEKPGTSYIFAIDGTTVCTNSTNLPTSGTNTFPQSGLRTLTTAARNIRVAYVYFEMDK